MTCSRRQALLPWAREAALSLAVCLGLSVGFAQTLIQQPNPAFPEQPLLSRTVFGEAGLPPQAAQARRFVLHRGAPAHRTAGLPWARANAVMLRPNAIGGTAPAWKPLGPIGVTSLHYGLVTGRVTSLALDPSDATGNKLYVGTTGGGVWVSQNAATADAANVSFAPLTDSVGALKYVEDASISIGALTVQPGGTGVILAGTGDPNDALDSYYGGGILRSADGGSSWTLIQATHDWQEGLSTQSYTFFGEGFAGFAWSTLDPNVVVAAVSQSAEGVLVSAQDQGTSYKGLFYSRDSGATWHLARISDGSSDVQGPMAGYATGSGSAATAVIWNPIRKVFIAAVRFHGYYRSPDGVTWTRLTAQPGSGLTTAMCPTNPGMPGSIACPIFRGALAVNPLTGDTFAWTVDANNQDQGLWQDVCAATGGVCTTTIAFGKTWSTAALETGTAPRALTVANGDYNLTLAAVPADQDTVLLAGANDLWKCSLAMGCVWRNTTNAMICATAQVAPYQHVTAWSMTDPLEVLVGNDGGLWRSLDGIAETGSSCATDDASHWQNLNGGLGSLAEINSLSLVGDTPYTMLAGFGALGTAGVKSTSAPIWNWPEILSGEGGPVAIDPTNPDTWYANNGAGVSIHVCSTSGSCAQEDFGTSPAVSNASVAGDGYTMIDPAPFLVDPVDSSQLLIGTCRLWRGPAQGGGWTAANAVTPMLDGNLGNSYCSGNAQIRSMAALRLQGGGEVVYVGLYGRLDGGATLGGHVLKATMNAIGTWSGWNDLTMHPVSNDSRRFNYWALDISSITIDAHDPTGNTAYVTVEGAPTPLQPVSVAYRTIDGGDNWKAISPGLPWAPANALAVDPLDASTAYIATDLGVFSTRSIGSCGDSGVSCWTAYGAGLPLAPAVTLDTSSATAPQGVLIAGTYGRGVWKVPLLTATQQLATVSIAPNSIAFDPQINGTRSAAQTVTVSNPGTVEFDVTGVTVTGDFGETDTCANATVYPGGSCTIQVTFTPSQKGTRSGKLTISGNVASGSLSVDLSGTGLSTGVVELAPGRIDFGVLEAGTQSDALQVTVGNSGDAAVSITSIGVSGPFVISTNSCGTTSLPGHSNCVVMLKFVPTQSGSATGVLTFLDSAGTQTVQLTGTGTALPTDTLSTSELSFPDTIVQQASAPEVVTITNSGANPLTSIQVSVSGAFVQTNTCTTQLAAGASCAISIVFQPAIEGVQKGTLSIADIFKTQTVTLSGKGLKAPFITVSPTSLAFGAQQASVPSSPLTLTVTNSGGAAMTNVGFQITGPSAASFSTGATTCGASLGAAANCTVQVVFTPVAAGASVANLIVTSSTLNVTPVTVPLNGTGQSTSALSVSPIQLSFAATAVGQTSAPQSVTITNSAGTAANGLAVTVTGAFQIAQSTCSAGLGAGATCSVGIVFAPMQTGNLTGTLTVATRAPATPFVVALSGTGGLAGVLKLQPALVDFPTTGVGAASSPIAVTLTNTSTTAALADLALTTSAGFQLASSTCGTSLAAGANCTASVVFAPTKTGAQSGALTIASSDLLAAATVPLSGMGFDFTMVVIGATTQTVAAGQTANFTLMLTPSPDVAATFTFACGSLPTYAACLFNPSSNAVAANATGTQIVQITTTQSVARNVATPLGNPWSMVSLACGVLLLPLAARKRCNLLMLILVLALAVAGMSSCAGSGGGGGGTAPTNPTSHNVAPGTYPVVLTAKANGVQHTVPLTLVVD